MICNLARVVDSTRKYFAFERNLLNVVACRLCALDKTVEQRFGIAVCSKTGAYCQNLFSITFSFSLVFIERDSSYT